MSKLKLCLAGEYPLDTSRIGGGVLHVIYLLGEAFAERDDKEVRYLRGRGKLAARLQSRLQCKALGGADAVISVAQYGLDAYARWNSKTFTKAGL